MSSQVMPLVRPARVVALLFVALILCAADACKKDQSAPTAATNAQARANTPSAFEPRSSRIIAAGAEPHPTFAERTPAESDDAGADDDYSPVSISVDADPDSGGAPLTVTFQAEVDGGPPGLRYQWDFGDRSPPARQLRAEHTYQTAGEYTATFSAIGPGVEETQEATVEVNEDGFDLDIEADPDIGPAPLSVHFAAVLDEDLPGPFYFQWNFGDGGRDVNNPTTHVYRAPGEYTVTLTATNATGQSATRETEITVDPREDSAN